MTTSRLMIRTVSQIGHRIEPRPEARLLARTARDQSVESVGDAGCAEHDECPPQVAVDDEDHERRDKKHPEQRQLVCDREYVLGHAPRVDAQDVRG